MALNLTGVLSKGILKLKLAFDSNVSINERNAKLAGYAKSFCGSGRYTILSTKHFADGSSLEAKISS